ncbi:hypothetical protein [Mycobacteroides saopaulense]|uniref:hypothetical protein n=1 Tax=Mycobacteroides saopaulense TaxID=1578165 RepID=UPI000AACF514|nr:hypothetical protein [Mycobacteroides saopaulense]
MSELSGAEATGRWKNARHPERRCVAHKKNGDRCGHPARRGTTVCDFHGAKAGHVRRKAKQRLEEAADRMARQLLGMATNDDVSDSVKLAAIRDALDRAGVSTKSELELSVKEPKPYEQIFAGMAAQTREQYRANAHPPAPLALPPGGAEEDVVDAEVVPETPPSAPVASLPHENHGDGPDSSTAASTPSQGGQLVPLEDAQAQVAEANRKSGVYPVRRVRRGR